jgi:hypothetical protein
LIISGVAMASIRSTLSSVISLPACVAAVSEFDCVSAVRISTLYDLSPSMIPSATSSLIVSSVNGFASPKPARGPVSGAVKPTFSVPSPPPPPNLAALPAPLDGAVVAAPALVVAPAAVVAGAVVAAPADVAEPAVVAGAAVVPDALDVDEDPPSSSPHAARTAAAAAPPVNASNRRRLNTCHADRSFGAGVSDAVMSSPWVVCRQCPRHSAANVAIR